MNLRPAIAALEQAGVPDPARDARRLYDWAYAQGSDTGQPQDRDHPNDRTREFFDLAVRERMARRPVSQIIGLRAFWKHEFIVTGDVLDPRPDTETLVDLALAEPFDRVLDLGTGSGCIILSLLAERPAATGLGVDVSADALAVAQENAERLGVAARFDPVRSDWFAAVRGHFDLIVSNPPYIGAGEMAGLSPEVRDWEPEVALTDGGDGLTAYRRIAEAAPDHMAPGGRLLVEIGPTQAEAVSELFRGAGLAEITVSRDLDGRDRVVGARKAQ